MAVTGVRQRVARLAAPVRRAFFPGSADYWESRYAAGGNSGGGSFGELAEFKARTLNEFVERNDVQQVIEFGCGDGNQLALARYPRYIGLDVAPTAIERCLALFGADHTKSFTLYSTRSFSDPLRILRADLAISMDVIYHLVEDALFEQYLRHLFAAADKFVIIYSSNEPLADAAPHVRHREFTGWVANNIDDWRLRETVENPLRGSLEAAVADFYVYERR